MWFFLNLYLQQVLGLDAFASGSALLPMTTIIMVIMIALAPRLMNRFGARYRNGSVAHSACGHMPRRDGQRA